MSVENLWNEICGSRKREKPREKPTQTPFRPPRNPREVTETRTRDPSGGRRAPNRLRHEAAISLRRYGSKLVYHITIYFLFTLVSVTCKYSTLTQLTYHFASYNSCSNWRPPTSMQPWHRRTRFCRTLTNIPGAFWISQAATILVTNSMSVSTGVSNTSEFRYSHRNNEGDSGQVTSQAME